MNAAVNIVRRIVSAAAAFAAAVCFMAFCPTASSGEDDMPTMAELADQMGVLINEARAEAGLEPLYMIPYLNDRANVRSRECIERFDHIRPTGERFYTVIDYDLVTYDNAGEIIAAGNSDPEKTLDQWRNSEKHWNTIMNTNSEGDEVTYDCAGIGVCYEENSDFKWYWTVLFVDIDDDLSGAYIPQKFKIVPQGAGDMTGDGVLNNFDYIVLSRHIVYGRYLNELQLEAADLFKDGQISIADAVVLKRYLLGRYKTLPVTLDMI